MKGRSLVLIACLGSLLLLPAALYGCKSEPKVSEQQAIARISSDEGLRQIADSITVKVLVGDSAGSGTLIRKEGQIYTVLTNNHVLTGREPYRIQTRDGKIYTAQLAKNVNFQKKDLALLQFSADADYTTANLAETRFLGDSEFIKTLKVGEEVFAAGFPYDADRLAFSTGKIALLPDKAFEGGYRIGYTSDIQKGMSGGPVLNRWGEVIAVNGMLAYPPLGDPHVFEDGDRPTDAQRQEMIRSSWAVPIQTLAQLAPEFATEPEPPFTGLVKEVNDIAKQITVRIDSPAGNGSGVIIAHQGNTYYVLTAEHVVRYENTYEVVTPDGRRHPVDYSTVKKMSESDLAVLQFASSETYRVATLANYDLEKGNRWVFVSGWPGLKQTNTEAKRRFFNIGQLLNKEDGQFQAQNSDSLTYGYGLVYNNITVEGMSGGPLLDNRGYVIGIHGRAEGAWDKINKAQIYLGYSLGIPISTFLSLAETLHIDLEKLKIATSPPLILTEIEKDLISKSLLTLQIAKDSKNALAFVNYGNQLWRLHRYNEAIEAFDRAIQIKPDFYQAWYARGLTFMFPNFSKIDIKVVTLENKNLKFVATVPEEYEKAVHSFDKTLEIEPKFYPALRLRGNALINLNRYEEALKSLDKALELNPDDFSVEMLRGDALSDLKRYPSAISAYSRSLAINPHPWVYYNRGVARLKTGDNQGALDDFTEALRLKPNYVNAYNNRGVVRLQRGDYKGAIDDFTEGLRFNPDDATAYLNRGSARAAMGNYQEAIADYNKVLRLNPDEGDAYMGLGGAHAAMGNYDEAIADYNKVIKRKPDDATAHYNRGLAYILKTDKEKAIEDLQISAQLFRKQGDISGYQTAQQVLGKLQQ